VVAVALAAAVAGLLLLSSEPAAAQAEDGEALYRANCSGCHGPTGAGTPGIFPPLAGNPNVDDAAYVRDTIRNGKQGPLIVDGIEYNGQMPAFGPDQITDAGVDAIVEYVQTGLGGEQATTTTLPPIAIQPLPESALLGEQLFLGQAAFEAGGPACAACHTAGRYGDLAPRDAALGTDLTDLWERAGGADGFVATLTDPEYLAVHTAYRDATPSADEVTALASFFAEGVGEQRSEFLDSLLLIGAAGLFALIATTAFVAAARRDREEAR
jgi:mono/diheme cytochrome c family protein